MTRLACVGVVLTTLASLSPPAALPGAQQPPLQPERAALISYPEARPILEQLRASLPADLATAAEPALESSWPAWVSRHDADIRDRLRRGDEDSLVNLLLFGTTFTKLPRALNDSSRLGGRERAAELVRGRLADMVAALASPGENERLLFARQVVERQRIDPATAQGRERARQFLFELMTRVTGEAGAYARTIEAARAEGRPEFAVRSTLYRERGLSSDTSIRPDFAVDRALEEIASKGLLGAGAVRRVAVVGPGLDFTDKADGYDFYPQQITQPFSVANSLLRLRLATIGDLRLTTFDLSPRVNLHLQMARQRATSGGTYDVVLLRERDSGWRPELAGFWGTFGGSIGETVRRAPSPPPGIAVDVRAVRIRPEVIRALEPRDLNVVLQRLAPLADGERFDLAIATNVLVYYDVFEQSLALANVAAMLRPGGVLLSNNVLVELPTTPISSIGSTLVTYSSRPDDSDEVVWYRRH